MANQSNDIIKAVLINVCFNLLLIVGNIAYMHSSINDIPNEISRYTNLLTGPKRDMAGNQITSKNSNYLLSIVDNILNIPILVMSFILIVTGSFLGLQLIQSESMPIMTLGWLFINFLIGIWNIMVVKEFIQFFFSRKVS